MGQTPMVFDGCHLSHRWTTVIVLGFSHGFPDSSRMTDTCPPILTLVVPPRLCHCWDIVDRDSQRRGFFVFENPDFPIHDSSGSSDTRHHCLDGSDPIGKSRIVISLCNGSTLLKSPMVKSRRLPRTLTRVLPRSTTRIRSRDFENHKVSILRLNKTSMTQISRWLFRDSSYAR
jgi:hypothetical protein